VIRESLPHRNLLRRDFVAAQPNRVWLADITYIPTREGFLHLAFILDTHSRKIVGWSMDSHMRMNGRYASRSLLLSELVTSVPYPFLLRMAKVELRLLGNSFRIHRHLVQFFLLR
jgi:hypothetical protein